MHVRRGVIGVLTEGEALLVIRRAAGLVRAGCWCFPGGHVEAGETSRRAIQRELLEELHVHGRPTERLGAIQLPDIGYVLVVWRIDHDDRSIHPAPAEIAEARWLTVDQIRSIKPGLPSNDRVLELLGV